MTNNTGGYKKRIAFTIPDFNKFGELLHDRFHTVLYHIEEVESKFMLITNLFDRNPERVKEAEDIGLEDTEALMYAGTSIQRVILEKKESPKNIDLNNPIAVAEWEKTRDVNWSNLSKSVLTRENGSKTVEFFDKFRSGQLELADIKVEPLREYFAKMDSDFKEYEYPIIDDYFDIPNTYYVGIPLMGMGLFQGIIWVLFKEEEISRFSDPKTIKRLIKIFQMEYDQLVLSWDIFGVNMNRKSVVERAIKEVIDLKNPIQEECKIKRYYEISEYYQKERIKQNDAVPDKLYGQYLKTATITTLLDSYAHNISAHSLTSLSWWFRERGDYSALKENKEIIAELGRDNNPLIVHLKQNPQSNLSNELHRLFKFLLEKGAFWSGITRQTNFAGKVSNLYNVLWFDFANNPLYLGTIANTEDVRKISLNLTIYENESKMSGERFKNVKKIKRTPDGILLDGTFAIVNLDDFGKHPEKSKTSIFVEEGDLFGVFKSELENIKAFFPGGVIGKHAFFTLLENEIRNVKHYKDDILKDIQKKGLVLNISIHERPADSSKNISPEQYPLLKIGVWLKHPVNITSDLLVRRIDGLEADIVTPETFQPRLGGNYQDKICASMLMTNTFDKVQDTNSPIGKIYYPWIKTAGYKIRADKDQFVEFEVSHRGYRLALEQGSFETDFSAEKGTGYLKKYFHMWKGAEVISISSIDGDIEERIENKSRFRFLNLEKPDQDLKKQLKSDGTIRVVSELEDMDNVAAAYAKWLPIWLDNNSGSIDTVIDFKEDETEVGRITYQNGQIRFESYHQIQSLSMTQFNTYKAIPNRIEITIEHGSKLSLSPDKLNYRSHGELMTRFCKGLETMSRLRDMDAADAYELLESLSTKICLFDRRIYSRLCANDSNIEIKSPKIEQTKKLQQDRLHLYRKNLLLDFRTENQEEWEGRKKEGFLNLNFLVIHLSFIEGMKIDPLKEATYSEEQIIQFIDDQILQGIPPEQVPDNFILVITTGRGRMAWWDTIKANLDYARFTTFRPIESLLGTVEDALQLPDDINLKFNLTKLLFGS